MSFGGHVLDMINREAYNRSLRKAYRQRFTKLKDLHLENIKLYSGEIEKKQISKEDLEILRAKIRESIIKDRKESIIKTALITILVTVFLAWLVFDFIL
jgi:hypothetical protein